MKKVKIEKRAGRLVVLRWNANTGEWVTDVSFRASNVENWSEIKIDTDDEKYIEWSVVDFQDRATEREEVFQWDGLHKEKPTLFDREKMSDALSEMISKHDANLGITWDTVDYYLDERCKFEKPIFYEKGQVKN